eukprot:CCRYP_009014-RA/>CCRYP_009014-RA protein AED:0.27 eAED:0.71 QI:0/0/0/1/0/0/3/0/313
MVQYYLDLWARCSKMLAPLTSLAGEVVIPNNPNSSRNTSKAFDDVKATIAKDVSLAYPDYSRGFEIYTDGSKRQLGAVITQNNLPIAFFSRKLSVCQQKYSYGLEIVYIEGIHNTVVDAISRRDFGPIKDVKDNWMAFTKCWCYYTMQSEEETSQIKHTDLMNFVFANQSKENAIYPLTVREIAAAQHTDRMLDKLSLLEAYKPQLVENVQVLCKDGKLVIAQELQQQAVQWYHHYLQHPGTTRLEETLHAAMYWKGFRHSVCSFVKKCHKCQVNEQRQHKYVNSLLNSFCQPLGNTMCGSNLTIHSQRQGWH